MRYFSLGLLWALTACNNTPVKPWERGYLAQPIMNAPLDLHHDLLQHTFLSKEAASGGSGVAAGGCGCN
jgi:hypothetical protein